MQLAGFTDHQCIRRDIDNQMNRPGFRGSFVLRDHLLSDGGQVHEVAMVTHGEGLGVQCSPLACDDPFGPGEHYVQTVDERLKEG